jgi:hypothetical protein
MVASAEGCELPRVQPCTLAAHRRIAGQKLNERTVFIFM